MGVFSTFCAFCSGPLDDAHESWHEYLKGDGADYPPGDGEWYNPPGYPVPTKEESKIIRITPQDGEYWNDWVCIGPLWQPSYVSPACTDDPYGGIYIDDEEMTDQIGRTSRFHRGCLSLFCRFANSNPQTLYESLYAEGSDYLRFGEIGNGLLYCIAYYHMEGRAGQSFNYAVERRIPPEDGAGYPSWHDPETMEECNWLLARPTVFPVVPDTPGLVASTGENVALRTATSSSPSSAAHKVFNIPELLDILLSALIEPLPKITISDETFKSSTPPSLATSTRVLLGLLAVDKSIRNHILTSRQDLFLSLAWQHAWMLPCTPLDGQSWAQVNPSIPLSEIRPSFGSDTQFHYQPASRDWRAYLLKFLRKDDPHVRNRWRMYRMAMQFALGKKRPAQKDVEEWKWHCGDASYVPMPFEEGMDEDWEVPVPFGEE